ncbi:MAG: type II 3-dehydroquinate dehydratase, partial [Rhodospirillaceae bacterium]
MTQILVINGPNLNALGQREPELYGHETLADIEALCVEAGNSLGLEVECFQSNSEGAMIDRIHAAREESAGIVINAGA